MWIQIIKNKKNGPNFTKERENPFEFDERAHLWQQVLYCKNVKTRWKRFI